MKHAHIPSTKTCLGMFGKDRWWSWSGSLKNDVGAASFLHTSIWQRRARHAISPDDQLQSMTKLLPYHLAYHLYKLHPDRLSLDHQLTSFSPRLKQSTQQLISMARLSGLQREILSLYRKCLRETRKKPAVRLCDNLPGGRYILTLNRMQGQTSFVMLSMRRPISVTLLC